jgi:ArsR family transcriptional regulator, arsenate/arsenite/antimonite-responsive transcriptional repressor
MPFQTGRPVCRAIVPSALSELAWIVDLLVQTARYAEPALAELDASLLPGIRVMRRSVMQRSQQLWGDGLSGCPELIPLAQLTDCLLDDRIEPFFASIGAGRISSASELELLTETPSDRKAILRRLARLRRDSVLRGEYRTLLREVWQAAAPAWRQTGHRVVVDTCAEWKDRLKAGSAIETLVPPRHPLARADELGFDDLFVERAEYVVSPLYFCMSGGHVVDLGHYVHIGVPASDLLPVRKGRDAAFVAYRLRVLSEASRVRVLLEVLAAPAGVMQIARALTLSQPTVSGHLKVLREAGLVQPRRMGGHTVFAASRKRIERLLEDARATIIRWD